MSREPPRIEGIVVVGGEKIRPAEIREQSGLRVGGTWREEDRVRAVQALLRLPLIQDVRVKGERSSRGVEVRIAVTERRPYGVVAAEEREPFWWVDREGFVLGPVGHPTLLPVVTGVEVRSTPRGKRVAHPEAIGVISEFYVLPGRVLARFSELRYRGYDLVLRARAGWRALLPVGGLSSALDRLERVVAALTSREGSRVPDWRVLDLRFAGEVTVGR